MVLKGSLWAIMHIPGADELAAGIARARNCLWSSPSTDLLTAMPHFPLAVSGVFCGWFAVSKVEVHVRFVPAWHCCRCCRGTPYRESRVGFRGAFFNNVLCGTWHCNCRLCAVFHTTTSVVAEMFRCVEGNGKRVLGRLGESGIESVHFPTDSALRVVKWRWVPSILVRYGRTYHCDLVRDR